MNNNTARPPSSCGPQDFPWIPTRRAGLDRLHAFAPLAAGRYAALRNTDYGPDGRTVENGVSGLSPWLASGLLAEAEVLAVVGDTHPDGAAEKFEQEVLWRTYWRGWLTRRPGVWEDFTQDVDRLDASHQTDDTRAAAEGGRTGIACFDAWVAELRETGYLHNHARMWFASIWIFTLRLPWQLGAAFFLDHLMDGDAASNTLSWRWVAGLHTKGKQYLARADNIEAYTNRRWSPDPKDLADSLEAAGHAESPDLQWQPHPEPAAVPQSTQIARERTVLVLGEGALDSGALAGACEATAGREMAGVVISRRMARLNGRTLGGPAHQFRAGALDDAAQWAAADGYAVAMAGEPCDSVAAAADAVIEHAKRLDARQLVLPVTSPGWTAAVMDAVQANAAEHNLRVAQHIDAWNSALWPLATAGFFGFWKKACKQDCVQALRGE